MTIKGERAATRRAPGRKHSKKLLKHPLPSLHTQNVRSTRRTGEGRADHTRELSRLSEMEVTYHQQTSIEALPLDHHRKAKANKRISRSKLPKDGFRSWGIHCLRTLQCAHLRGRKMGDSDGKGRGHYPQNSSTQAPPNTRK